ncbi:hypothetical protein B0H14DRAFT_3701131 [Mycena olivaceomarginata]|nr:hypothetical protein B0H14DRAFT_3701131 [Mycena olivaceomarginata]
MSSRTALYQTKLTGYFRVRAQPVISSPNDVFYHEDEGRQWWPINVDSGSWTDPIDVEWWTVLRAQPVQPTVEGASLDPAGDHGFQNAATEASIAESSSAVSPPLGGGVDKAVDNKVFECGICWDTLYKPVITMCMHIFCYDCLHKWLAEKKKMCPLCRTRVKEQPIRDCAFEEELEAAVVDGRVAEVEGERVTESAYGWAGVGF